jgi:phosphoglycerate kinase
MANIPSITDLNLRDKNVLVRVDFNVPLNEREEITDDTRIVKALPTIQYILNHGGKVILMSHLGRPDGKKTPKYSLRPCADRLQQLIAAEVLFAPDCIGAETEMMAKSLKNEQVLLLENLRFYAAEEKPSLDLTFAQNLSKLADIYIDDAFGAAHRKHSSITEIVKYFPQKAAMGFLMKEEVSFFSSMLTHPQKPFYALIGGAKISTKMGVLSSLLSKVDAIFIGGGMSYTFFKAQGLSIGNSIFEKDLEKTALDFLDQCQKSNVKVFLPKDIVIADRFDNEANRKIIRANEGIPEGWEGMDIGPETLKEWEEAFASCKTLFWNGPVGVFEFPNFAQGTHKIASIISKLNATTIVGGGDSVAAINQMGLSEKFSHVSTGGGASLEFIELGSLPGISALMAK